MGVLAFSDVRDYLLDTHTFLWAAHEPERLGKRAREVIEDINSRLYLSAVSAYEVTNKYRNGKLDEYRFVVDNYTEIARKLGTIELPVTLAHMYQAGQMDWEHRDPFDRILAAQAALENLVIITHDAMLRAHPWFETVW
ncbi:MAG: type II toxin-antitoxin system VapC family toxin [Coriobacteriia bacterium]|nr:type II toxin-antitoxin system VapC family toxin [Coriobacteriia bacterium]